MSQFKTISILQFIITFSAKFIRLMKKTQFFLHRIRIRIIINILILFFETYSNNFIYNMINKKKLRYREIKIDLITLNEYVIILLRFRDQLDKYALIQNEKYIVLDLFCEMIIKIIILKFNNIIIY